MLLHALENEKCVEKSTKRPQERFAGGCILKEAQCKTCILRSNSASFRRLGGLQVLRVDTRLLNGDDALSRGSGAFDSFPHCAALFVKHVSAQCSATT